MSRHRPSIQTWAPGKGARAVLSRVSRWKDLSWQWSGWQCQALCLQGDTVAASLTGLTDWQGSRTFRCQVGGAKVPREPAHSAGWLWGGGLRTQPWKVGVHRSLLGCTGPHAPTVGWTDPTTNCQLDKRLFSPSNSALENLRSPEPQLPLCLCCSGEAWPWKISDVLCSFVWNYCAGGLSFGEVG